MLLHVSRFQSQRYLPERMDNLADLLRERYDLAVRVTNRPPEDWVARALMPVNYVLVCAKKYERDRPATLDELKQHSVFMPKDRGFGTTCYFAKDGQEYLISIQPRLITNNGDAMLDAVLEGRGCLPISQPVSRIAE